MTPSNTQNSAEIACDLLALTEDERREHREILPRVIASANAISETDTSFQLTFRSHADLISMIARWMIFERRCCPFLKFELIVDRATEMDLLVHFPEEAKEMMRDALAIHTTTTS